MKVHGIHALLAGLILLAVSACGGSSGGGGGSSSSSSSGGGSTTGTVTGTVVDATSGTGVPALAVTDTAAAVTTSTSTTGSFTLANVPPGARTITFAGTGFATMTRSVTVTAGQTSALGTVSVSPSLTGNARRFVLSWGLNPSDLDFYMSAPDGKVAWYVNQDPEGNQSFFLDFDVTDSYGPETMTVNAYQNGTYHLLVNDFTNGGGDTTGTTGYAPTELGTSGAIVQEYTSAGLVNTYPVPNCTGVNYWWNVLTLTTTNTTGPGTVALVNTCAQNVSGIITPLGTRGPQSKPLPGGGK